MSGESPVAARTINLIKDPTGAPAVNLSKVREAGHVDLVKRAEKAGISLSKRNMSGLRGAVRLYVDHSGSMEFPEARDYSNGNVQRLVERALGYAFQLDSDGKIPVIAFDHRLWPEVIVDQTNYEGIVESRIWHSDQMGGTKFGPVLDDLLTRRRTASDSHHLTDGSPSDPAEATELVIELAKYPVQIKFLAIRAVEYLGTSTTSRTPARRETARQRRRQVLRRHDCPELSQITDLQFADAMADEIDTWVRDATAKGVLLGAPGSRQATVAGRILGCGGDVRDASSFPVAAGAIDAKRPRRWSPPGAVDRVPLRACAPVPLVRSPTIVARPV